MFKKTMISAKYFAKKAITSNRMKTMGLMLLLGCGAAMAQNSAGDYTAGTTALSTVTEEIAKYVPIVVKLCYAIAGVVAVVGAISVYIAITSTLCGDVSDSTKLHKIATQTARNVLKLNDLRV